MKYGLFLWFKLQCKVGMDYRQGSHFVRRTLVCRVLSHSTLKNSSPQSSSREKLRQHCDQVSSTRSVGLNLAQRFNAGITKKIESRRVATIECRSVFRRRYATAIIGNLLPALKRRSKFNRRYASKTFDQGFLTFVQHSFCNCSRFSAFVIV